MGILNKKVFILEVLFFSIILICAFKIGLQETYADWTEQTNSGQRTWTSVASSADGTKLAATVSNGYIYTSTDSGATWTEQSIVASRNWTDITSSADGTKLAATVTGDYIYISTDSGSNWTTQAVSNGWQAITSSSDGSILGAIAQGGCIFNSTDSGNTWTDSGCASGVGQWTDITSSSNGTYFFATANSNDVYVSNTSGNSWNVYNTGGASDIKYIASSATGERLIAAAANGYLHISNNYGGEGSWTQVTGGPGSQTWSGVASSADGTKLVAIANTGYVYTSTDSGTTWTQQVNAGEKQWTSVASSEDGTKLVATVSNGFIYTMTPDVTAPTITSVSSDKSNGAYTVGEVIDIDVTFSENVTSTGNVTVTLETGATDRTCTFTVSNSTTGTCNYTVQAGDTSSDLTVSSISGTIADQSANAMSNFTPATNLAANKALVIDTTAPTVSITAPTEGATVSGASVAITASASDTNLVGVQFKRDTNTNIGAEDTTSTYGVTWDTTELSDGAQSLIAVARDSAGNYATSTAINVTVDNTAPTIQTLSPSDNATDIAVDSNLSITFDSVISIGTGNILIKQASDDSTFATIDVEGGLVSLSSLDRVSINPSSDFAEGTEYYIQIASTAIEDEAGNSFAGISDETTWSFTTVSAEEDVVEEDETEEDTPRTPTRRRSINFVTKTTEKVVQSVSTTYEKITSLYYEYLNTDQSNTTKRQEILNQIATQFSYLEMTKLNQETETQAFTLDLEFPVSHPDVKRLQQFLNNNGYTVADEGPGSKGNETTIFGYATRAALIRFQKANNITPAVGYFGPITRGVVNNLLN